MAKEAKWLANGNRVSRDSRRQDLSTECLKQPFPQSVMARPPWGRVRELAGYGGTCNLAPRRLRQED